MRLRYKDKDLDITKMFDLLTSTASSDVKSGNIHILLKGALGEIYTSTKKTTQPSTQNTTTTEVTLLIKAIELGHLEGLKALLQLATDDKEFKLRCDVIVDYNGEQLTILIYAIRLHAKACDLKVEVKRESQDEKGEINPHNIQAQARGAIIDTLIDFARKDPYDTSRNNLRVNLLLFADNFPLLEAAAYNNVKLAGEIFKRNTIISIYNSTKKTHYCALLVAIKTQSYDVFKMLCTENKSDILSPSSLKKYTTNESWNSLITEIFDAIHQIPDLDQQKAILKLFIETVYASPKPPEAQTEGGYLIHRSQQIFFAFERSLTLKKVALINSYLEILSTLKRDDRIPDLTCKVSKVKDVFDTLMFGALLRGFVTSLPKPQDIADDDTTRCTIIDAFISTFRNDLYYDQVEPYVDFILDQKNLPILSNILKIYIHTPHTHKACNQNKENLLSRQRYTNRDLYKFNEIHHQQSFNRLKDKIAVWDVPQFKELLKQNSEEWQIYILKEMLAHWVQHDNEACLIIAIKQLIAQIPTEFNAMCKQIDELSPLFLHVITILSKKEKSQSAIYLWMKQVTDIKDNTPSRAEKIEKMTALKKNISTNEEKTPESHTAPLIADPSQHSVSTSPSTVPSAPDLQSLTPNSSNPDLPPSQAPHTVHVAYPSVESTISVTPPVDLTPAAQNEAVIFLSINPNQPAMPIAQPKIIESKKEDHAVVESHEDSTREKIEKSLAKFNSAKQILLEKQTQLITTLIAKAGIAIRHSNSAQYKTIAGCLQNILQDPSFTDTTKKNIQSFLEYSEDLLLASLSLDKPSFWGKQKNKELIPDESTTLSRRSSSNSPLIFAGKIPVSSPAQVPHLELNESKSKTIQGKHQFNISFKH